MKEQTSNGIFKQINQAKANFKKESKYLNPKNL